MSAALDKLHVAAVRRMYGVKRQTISTDTPWAVVEQGREIKLVRTRREARRIAEYLNSMRATRLRAQFGVPDPALMREAAAALRAFREDGDDPGDRYKNVAEWIDEEAYDRERMIEEARAFVASIEPPLV